MDGRMLTSRDRYVWSMDLCLIGFMPVPSLHPLNIHGMFFCSLIYLVVRDCSLSGTICAPPPTLLVYHLKKLLVRRSCWQAISEEACYRGCMGNNVYGCLRMWCDWFTHTASYNTQLHGGLH